MPFAGTMHPERASKMARLMIFSLTLSLISLHEVSSQVLHSAVYELPCDRTFGTPGFIQEDGGVDACVEACYIWNKKYAVMYLDSYCFCSDAYTETHGVAPYPVSAQNLTSGQCAVDHGPFAAIYYAWPMPQATLNRTDISSETDPVVLVNPSASLTYSNESEQPAIAEFDLAGTIPSHVLMPVKQLFLEDAILLRSYEETEVDIYVYKSGVLDRPSTFSAVGDDTPIDCVLSYACERITTVIEKRSIEMVAPFELVCPTRLMAGASFECDIVVYGQDFNLDIDFGDGQPTSSRANLGMPDSAEAVFGFTDTDKYFTGSASLMSVSSTQLLVYHRVINEPGLIHAWEYSMAQAGVFRFSVYSPDCGNQFYCHKTRSCVASEAICINSVSSSGIQCTGSQVYSLSERVCVENGQAAFVEVPWTVDYKFKDSSEVDNQAADSSFLSRSLIHHLDTQDYIKVSPGDVLSVSVSSGEIETVSMPGTQTVKKREAAVDAPTFTAADQAYSAEPLLTAHIFKASTYTAEHTFEDGCFTHQVLASVTTSSGTYTADVDITVIEAIDHVEIVGPVQYGNSTEGYPIGATGESATFFVPEHMAYCDTDYYWMWNDSSPIEFVTGVSANHTYADPGIYTIEVVATTLLENISTSINVLVQDAVEDFKFVDLLPVYVFGVPATFGVSASQGSDPEVVFSPGNSQQVNYTYLMGGNEQSLSHDYVQPGYYDISVTIENYISSDSLEAVLRVEETISGLSLNYGDMFYDFPSSTIIDVSLATGSHVNFTCIVDNTTECSNWDITWENRGGQVLLDKSDYQEPGWHDVTITATNLITPDVLTAFARFDIFFRMSYDNIYVSTFDAVLSSDLQFLIHPSDPVTWLITNVYASRAYFTVTCNGVDQVNRYWATLDNENITLEMQFTTDGIYDCTVTITTPTNSTEEDYTFQVQYAVPNVQLELLSDSGQIGATEIILEKPEYWKILTFVLLRPTSSNRPTNCSWAITYDDEDPITSTEYITADDESSAVIANYEHMISFTRNFTHGDDYHVKVEVWNDITPLVELQLSYTVYEEIAGLTIASIQHILDGVRRPAHPNIYMPTFNDEGVLYDHYEWDSSLEMVGLIERGTHTTWSWDLGTSADIVTGNLSCSDITFDYMAYDPDTYTVTLNVSNPFNFLSVTRTITLQKRVQNLGLITPISSVVKNTTTDWTLNFGSLGTDACYFLDFNDPEIPVHQFAFGNTHLCQQRAFHDDYIESAVDPNLISDLSSLLPTPRFQVEFIWETLGQHNVWFRGVNLVSEDSVSFTVGVTKSFCAFPLIDLAQLCSDEAGCPNNIPRFKKSGAINIAAKLTLDCSGRFINHTWSLYKVDETSGSLERVEFDALSESPSFLNLPPLLLDYGTYEVRLNISMHTEIGIYSINSTTFEVVASPLVARLTPWPLMAVKFGEQLELNASAESYDPDDPDDQQGLSYTWLCRRYCEDYPRYNTATWEVEEGMTEYCHNYTYNNYGCFFDDAYNSSGLFTTTQEGSFLQPTNASYEKEVIFIKVYVTKDTRVAEAEVEVSLRTGDPPTLLLKCGINCAGKTNINQKFSFSSRVAGTSLQNFYSFRWELYNASGGLSWTQAKHNPMDESLWTDDLANTKPGDRTIAFRPNTQISSLTDKLFVSIKAWRGQDEENAGQQISPVIFNDPPVVNSSLCSVSPPNGTADDTLFSITCEEGAFIDEDLPFLYDISTAMSFGDDLVLLRGPNSVINNLNGFKLPYGVEADDFNLTVYINCYDAYGSSSRIPLVTKVLPRNIGLEQLMAEAGNQIGGEGLEALRSGDTESGYGTFMMVSNSLNEQGSRDELRCRVYNVGCANASSDTDTSAANETSADSSAEQQKAEELRAERKALREEAIAVVNEFFPQNTVQDIQKCNNVLGSLLAIEDEVSETAIAASTSKMSEGLDVLKSDTSVSYADTIKTVTSFVGLMGNLFSANKYVEEQRANNARAKRETSTYQSSLEDTFSLLTSVGGVLTNTLVPGETPEELTSSKLSLATSKNLVESFEGDMETPDGGAIILTDTQGVLGNPNTTEPLELSTLLTSMDNPFYSTQSENSTDSKTIRLVIESTGGDGTFQLQNSPNRSHNLFIPSPNAPLVPTAYPLGAGNSSSVRKLLLAPRVSLSIVMRPVLRSIVNDTNSTSNASAPVTDTRTAPGNISMDISNIGLRLYLKIEGDGANTVTVNDYDYMCELPSSDGSSSFTTHSKSGTGLPPSVHNEQINNDTCFLSDLVLNLDAYTYVYYTVEAFHRKEGSSRKRRSVDQFWEPTEGLFYEMTALSSQCRYFDPVINDWNTEGCEVGPLTTAEQTHCICSIITVDEPVSAADATTAAWETGGSGKYNPFGGISFGSGFSSPFNTIDFSYSNFNGLSDNPLVFTVMVSLACFYLCCLIWARRWDMKDEIKAGASPLLDNDPSDSYLYELTVFTGTGRGAGTTAKVSMIFAGFEEETPPRLIYDDKRPVLQNGGVDSFLMTVPRSLGPLNHIRVWHDNSGKSPGWQLAYMCVIDLITKDKFFFVCNNWLSAGEGDGAIDRIIPTATRDDLIDFSHLFWTKARKDLTDSHIWFSVFGRPPKSVFTRVQRITCCITLLFTSMVVGISLYQGEDSDGVPGQEFKIGPLTLTFRELQLGIYSSLLVFPINLFIVFIFRNCKHKESTSLRIAKEKARNYEKSHEKSLTDLRNSRSLNNNKKKKTQWLLPWWFQVVAYFLCLASCVVSFYFTILYSLTFGPKKSEQWMVSFVTSFIESLLLSQPIKVVLFAMFYALVIRSPTIEDELNNDPGLLQGEEYLHTHSKNYDVQHLQLQKTLAKYKVMPTPPHPEFIAEAKRKKAKEREMQKVLREVLAYVIFLYLLYSVSYGSKDPMTWRMFRSQQNSLEFGLHEQYGPMREGPGYTFEKPLPMSLVGSLDSFWVWAKQTYIPAVYSSVNYGGEDLPRGTTMDGVNFLVGTTRLRQIRVHEVNCPTIVAKYERHCADRVSKKSIDKGNYNVNWTKLPEGEEPPKGFKYENATVLEGTPMQGKFDYYEGGGYAHLLGKTQLKASKQIDYLIENNWIDERTRAIFVEFTTYNNQLNLFSVSYIVFELATTGAIYPKFDVKLVRPERYQSKYGSMVLLSELGMIAYTIYFVIMEIKLLKKLKRAYFEDFWNCVECLNLSLLLVTIALTIYRFYLLFETSERKSTFKHNDYISYQKLARFEESYLYLLAFLTFISTAKFLKLLRFNKKMNVLGYTLLYIAKPFLSFMVAMVLVFFAYAHMAFLVFNTLLLEFSSIFHSMATLFTLMLNKFDYMNMERASPLFAPLIFLTFTISMGFMMVNFMLSLIIDGFTTVRNDLADKPNKYELVDFVVSKFKGVMGLGMEQAPPVRDKHEDFVEDSQKELDVKFGEFSERVFGMFLQDPDDMKTMKMAEDLITREKKMKQKKKIVVS